MRLAIVLSSMLLAALPQARQSTAGASPSIYRVQLDTSKGAILVEVHRDWAPHGADRFHQLVAARYYDDNLYGSKTRSRRTNILVHETAETIATLNTSIM